MAALMTNTPVFNGDLWNHRAIIAADGRVALPMRSNRWSRRYPESANPVTDVDAAAFDAEVAERASQPVAGVRLQ